MKSYNLFRLKCSCSKRMKRRGRVVKIYEKTATRKCLNCGEIYRIAKFKKDIRTQV